ncbi:acetyl-CoA acetyltransferase [Advenella incenata]|uniref:Acetyl-CoA acetyltransferase n=1 Tax=Advenella incenata TaxID=267800 RepID=A0A4Q7VFV5_9BURK|nr:thiolase family protein [Advenella incenata]RZT94880.1 acetyl-CoA acetyltransferase [Advenella incenata]
MRDVYVVGTAMTAFGRFADATVKGLTEFAVSAAIKDSGLVHSNIGAIFYSNTSQSPLEGQHMIAGQVALRPLGFERIPIINVENACASSTSGLHAAFAYIRAGMCDVALVVGVDKMTHPDKAKSLALFDGAWDVHCADTAYAKVMEMGRGISSPSDQEDLANRSVFMDIYAALARFHMKTFGTTERQIAAVSSKNHYHSTFNRLAQYQKNMTIEEVLKAPMITWPLTLPMCAPVTDGGAAIVLTAGDVMAAEARKRAVKIRASVLASGTNRGYEEYGKNICHLAATQAYEIAGIEPKAISVAEVHDASAFAEISQIENLGFVEFGEGGPASERGDTKLGGRIPVNVSGGLESKGHPIAATGLGQIFELTRQLRGEAGASQVPNARFAIAENGGGFHGFEEGAACITILEGPST